MRKQKAIIRAIHCALALLIGVQVMPVRAFESPDQTHTTAIEADGGSAVEIAAMKEQIEKQQKQIEALQKAIEAEKAAVQKALNVIAGGNAVEGTGGASIKNAVLVRTSPALMAGTMPSASEGQADSQKLQDMDLVKGELEAVADSGANTAQRVTKLETDTAAYQKSNDAKVKQIGNFNFSGDLRVRYEPFFQEGAERHRERIRARFNLTGKLTDEFYGGITLATGSLDDPVSTNQTFTGFLNRKNFGLDKAWITFKPKAVPFLKLDAGKFSYPWYRTGLTFDGDVNPEGFAQTLSFDLKKGFLKNFTIVGFELPINEVSSGYDSFIMGGQVQAQFQIHPKVRLGLYLATVQFDRSDPIAVAVDNGSLKPSLPNSNTYRLSGGKVVGYASRFAYLDGITKLDINPNSRYPITLQFDIVDNMRGPRENMGYWGDFIVGKQSAQKDFQFTYSYIRIEKDAVISAFNESDLRSSTNVLDHKIQLAYMLRGNVTAQFTAWIGRLANPADNSGLVPASVRAACTGADISRCEDPLLKRLQFDLIYKF
jgi:hypothetical protein